MEFHGMGPVRRVLHAVGTPTAVYLLLVLGVWGIAFEVTQPGTGLAGIAGATFLAFAGYGLTVIPIGWLGFGLLLGGMGLQGLDVIVRRLGVLTASVPPPSLPAPSRPGEGCLPPSTFLCG